ncbi:50S ribosomal protein L18 [Candidatus Uhrbacteria bacterium]|jgi:large subunit ribosomal protein L18|nr:50S ribosomal protein L18 [Candidatus Uhrbacteria bacterium]
MSDKMKDKNERLKRRAKRVRMKVQGTAERPRLSVHRSLRHISVQMIDDVAGKTLVATSDSHVDAAGKKPVEVAALVGADIAKKAQAAGVTVVVFDRGPYLYHGRVKALAEAAREGGLKF